MKNSMNLTQTTNQEEAKNKVVRMNAKIGGSCASAFDFRFWQCAAGGCTQIGVDFIAHEEMVDEAKSALMALLVEGF